MTVLAAHADEIRSEGDLDRAKQIENQLASMRFFVERELARSRVAPTRQTSSDLKSSVEQMVEAIRKLPQADKIEWCVDIPEAVNVPLDQHDLSELLGNLLDNARKYARSKVKVSAREKDTKIELSIVDDGPGVPEDEMELIKQPGLQGTNSATGYGLGLAIVHDILELQGGDLVFENNANQGLTVVMTWDRT